MLRRLVPCVTLSLMLTWHGAAAQPAPPVRDNVTLFENVRVFDGKSASLSPPSHVLVRGNRIGPSRRSRSRSTAAPTRGSSTAAGAR